MRNTFGNNACDTDTLALKIVLHASKPFVPLWGVSVSFYSIPEKRRKLIHLEEDMYSPVALSHASANLCRAKHPTLPRHAWSVTGMSLFTPGKGVKD